MKNIFIITLGILIATNEAFAVTNNEVAGKTTIAIDSGQFYEAA